MQLDWKKLYFGRVSPREVAEAVSDDHWQAVRKEMRGASLEDKFCVLAGYYDSTYRGLQERAKFGGIDSDRYEHELRMLQVRCTSYVTALSRGGLIKPEDCR